MLHNRIFGTALILVSSSTVQALEKEAECLAKNIYYEARNQSTTGKLAVALVTLNRVESPKYPETICEVVWEEKQFSWTHDGKPDNPYELDKYESIKNLTLDLLNDLPSYKDFTEGSLHYHADYVSPCWSKLSEPTVVVNDHLFYNNLVGSPCIK